MLYKKKINLGVLEALDEIEMGLDEWLLAVGIKHPKIYFKFKSYYNSPAGREVTIIAISTDREALIKFKKEFDIGNDSTYNYDFNDEVYALVYPNTK